MKKEKVFNSWIMKSIREPPKNAHTETLLLLDLFELFLDILIMSSAATEVREMQENRKTKAYKWRRDYTNMHT